MNDKNQLIPLEELGIAISQNSALDDELTKSSDYLPQIRVYGSESTIVKEGKFPMGHLGLYVTAENVIDLGGQVDCLVINKRPRASIVTGDTPVSFYGVWNNEKREWDCSRPEFQDTKDRAKAKEQGYLAGYEFLLYVPSVQKYGLFLMGNPTLRRESPNMVALVGKAATAKVKLIKTAKFTWHGITIFECTTPFEIPSIEDMLSKNRDFMNPASSKVELADDGESSDRAR
jgi:hypothetical protein